MSTNVNLAAPVGALALLGTAGLLFVAVLVLIQSLIVRKRRRAKFVFIAMLVIAGAYLAAILIFSFASHEKVLARGQEKHFCEIDCHLAYSIVNTHEAKTLGDPPNQSTTNGTFIVITVKTRFDETSTSLSRGNGLLYPNSRALTLIDDQGNRYGHSSQLGTPLTTPLRPGESYTTDVAFDLPANAKPTTLLINEGDWITHFVIGRENNPLHKKTSFQIDLPATPLVRSDRYPQLWGTTLSQARCEQHQPVGYSQLIQSAGAVGPARRSVEHWLDATRNQ
jgi:hypothetical protein